MKKITIIIPALNEEQGIGLVLSEIPVGVLKNMGFETEVIVIDNGSEDRTRHIAMQHGATVIIQPMRGYGNAYKTGFAHASGDIIATGDADLTYPFGDLPTIIQRMQEEELDFISANRLRSLNRESMTTSHIFGNKLLTIIAKLLFNAPFVDSQSGMWIFKRDIWKKLNVRSSGMPFSQELKIEAYIRGFKCAEHPIKYRIRVGKSKLNTVKDGIRTVTNLFSKKLEITFTRLPKRAKGERKVRCRHRTRTRVSPSESQANEMREESGNLETSQEQGVLNSERSRIFTLPQ